MRKILIAVLMLFIAIPLLVLGVWSLAQGRMWPQVIPERVSFAAWLQILTSRGFIGSLSISLLVSVSVTMLALILGIPCAYALAYYDFRGKGLLWLLLIAPLIIPAISLAIGMHMVFLRLGLTDTIAGVVLSHLIPVVPYVVKIIHTGFKLLGKGLEDQAAVLGAGFLQRAVYIYLPNMLPALFLSGTLAFIVSFSQYLITFLIGGGMIKTLPIVMFPIILNGNRIEAAVYSLVFVFVAAAAAIMAEWILKKGIKSDLYI